MNALHNCITSLAKYTYGNVKYICPMNDNLLFITCLKEDRFHLSLISNRQLVIVAMCINHTCLMCVHFVLCTITMSMNDVGL
jgi:hypothetical protein